MNQQQYINTVDTDMRMPSVKVPQAKKVHNNSSQLHSLRLRINKLKEMEAKLMEEGRRDTHVSNLKPHIHGSFELCG